MDNYNSLTDQLIQNGIIKKDTSDIEETENLFEVGFKKQENVSQNKVQEVEIPKALRKNPKRINQTDMELIGESFGEKANLNPYKTIQRFINLKENLASKGALGSIENFFFTFFPRLYKAKLVRDAMSKLNELNIDVKRMLDKTIPYGENETRYQNLIKYINCANEIHTKIKKETY